jgi:ADP-ribose pyrophosphatase YjhB (NUDIX family)
MVDQEAAVVTCYRIDGTTIEVPEERLAFRPSAYAIVLRDSRLLVVRMRELPGIGLPGGGVELGETLEQALYREVREETGYQICQPELVSFKEHFFYFDLTGNAFHGYLFFYRAQLAGGNLDTSFDIDDSWSADPHWVDAAAVQPEDFNFHGALTVRLVHEQLHRRSA